VSLLAIAEIPVQTLVLRQIIDSRSRMRQRRLACLQILTKILHSFGGGLGIVRSLLR
jgi:hypothetical protein